MLFAGKNRSDLSVNLAYNNSMTLQELRAKHPRFHYRAFRWNHSGESIVIEFDFLLEPNITLTPRVEFSPVSAEAIARIPAKVIDGWVFHLGLIELFSYWKAAAPAEIVVSAGYLNTDQLAWWKNLLLKGMGEFFYTNEIDFTGDAFVRFVCDIPEKNSEADDTSTFITENSDETARYLVPVGGGKDSAVVLELLEENGVKYDVLLSFPQSPAAQKITALSRAENILTIKRTLDPTLLKLNKQGYLNGHTPFSARLAFESSLAGLLLNRTHILLGNEYSANEGNVPFHGTTVNHQYSKTFEFEQAFREYAKTYLPGGPEYLSLLRPISELQIAGIFSKYPRFHSIFKSCNRNQQQDSWCCECPKCLFVFAVLFPFLGEKQLVGPIFPENLFEKQSLQPVALALLGKDKHKPFECVGTYEETLAAFALSIQKFQTEHPGTELPAVLRYVQETVLAKDQAAFRQASAALCFWNPQHHVSGRLETIVRAAQQRVCEQADLEYTQVEQSHQ